MKKHYSLLFFVAAANFALAQPSLTAADLNPVIGEQITTIRATTMIPHGANGANVSWDFSAATQQAASTVYMRASSAAHPGTNLVLDYPGQAQLYYQNDNTQQSIKYQDAGGVLITFSDQMKMMGFPLNSNTSFTDAFAATFANGGTNFVRTGNTTITYMGYGTMKTPTGTYTNAIKIKFEQIYKDEYDNDEINYNTTAYYWYKAGIHMPIASSVTFTNDISPVAQEYTDYFASSILGIESISAVDFQIYPNPVNDILNINLGDGFKNTQTRVLNINGQELMLLENSTSKLDVSSVLAGIYFLEIKLENGQIATKKFQKL